MTPFDPQPAYFDPEAFPPVVRAVSLVLSIAVIGTILFQLAVTSSAIA